MSKPDLKPGQAPCEVSDLEPVAADVPKVVEFREVKKTYTTPGKPDFTSIEGVTFAVEDIPGVGEFIPILGPSGCGKSTVLRIIAGLPPHFPHTSGEVLVKDIPVSHPGPDRGMVFQDYANFPHLTVQDNVALGLDFADRPEKERRELSLEWIAKVGLDPKRDALKYPHELSGGMNQRVAIARTLIMQPRIILMDEPFGALDPVTRHRMQDLLVNLWRELEATVFFVTHDVAEAVFLGERIYIMSRSPGHILHQLRVTPPDAPSMETQKEKSFQDSVNAVKALLDPLED